eukprot:2921895-Prymnesium_polylepis.1
MQCTSTRERPALHCELSRVQRAGSSKGSSSGGRGGRAPRMAVWPGARSHRRKARMSSLSGNQ